MLQSQVVSSPSETGIPGLSQPPLSEPLEEQAIETAAARQRGQHGLYAAGALASVLVIALLLLVVLSLRRAVALLLRVVAHLRAGLVVGALLWLLLSVRTLLRVVPLVGGAAAAAVVSGLRLLGAGVRRRLFVLVCHCDGRDG